MESTFEMINDQVVATCRYESIDIKSADDFRAELEEACSPNAQLVLDLEHVEFVDSAGLGAIVATLKRLRSEGGDMKVCNVAKPVHELFSLVRMHQLVRVCDSLEEALNTAE